MSVIHIECNIEPKFIISNENTVQQIPLHMKHVYGGTFTNDIHGFF